MTSKSKKSFQLSKTTLLTVSSKNLVIEKNINDQTLKSEYKAKGVGWDYYRPRNLLIANKCDKVYSIALELIANGTKCYHCKKRGLDNNHFKTAGCWTAQRCKDYEIIVARGNSK